MGTIENIEELQKNILELNSVFTPEQFEKLHEILSPILVIIQDMDESQNKLKK